MSGSRETHSDSKAATIALFFMAMVGVALIFLFPGSPEQDSGYHFLMARASWQDPVFLVKVWARPFFTALFAGPVLLGWTFARFFAVAIGLCVAWQNWLLAKDLRMDRAWLVIPLLLGQPVFFELYSDLLTEPLFALIFVVALRWHLRGWVIRGILAASLLPLARPEGFFVGILWGAWILARVWSKAGSEKSSFLAVVKAIPATLLLATGVIAWWAAAWVITGDPLFIKNDWPPQWVQGTYGNGTLFSYAGRSLEIAGLFLLIPFLVGFVTHFRNRLDWNWLCVISPVLLIFGLHTVFWAYGLFGSAGFPRYMVCVAPSLAVITLDGCNTLFTMAVQRLRWSRTTARILGATVLATSITLSFVYLDGLSWSRDAVAIAEMDKWLEKNPRTVKRFIWSHAHMCVLTDRSIQEKPMFTADKMVNLKLLRDSAPGTLVVWDDQLGPDWVGLTAADIETAGYQLLRTRDYVLPGVLLQGRIDGHNFTRRIQVSALYKP
ncbi:MAG TPA: hypothetical protein VIT91_09530 [Chthoniobacterales bacterium]